ncbi:hypothetical protein AURDEDRAFT_160101 [Auricularia subglabra TFB-10046 SS5]|nr:hypothetical protein AURDEDRAFT_160101 [Auricularia subglabra TFB-10046 SS5]
MTVAVDVTTVTSVTVHRLVRNSAQDDAFQGVTLQRHHELPAAAAPPLPNPEMRKHFAHICVDPVPRLEIDRVEHGPASIAFDVGEVLGSGASGVVCAVENVRVLSGPANTSFPPLAVKIAKSYRAMEVVRESWAYDELECLQGVAVPRYYGLFTLTLPDSQRPKTWIQQYERDVKHAPSIPPELSGKPYSSRLRNSIHPELRRYADVDNVLVLLLIERMEELDYNSLPYHEDVVQVFNELAYVGVDVAADMGIRHVMRPLAVPPGFPSLPSPFTHRMHSMRVVDLNLAIKRCYPFSHLLKINKGWVETFDLPVRGDRDDSAPDSGAHDVALEGCQSERMAGPA